MIKIVRLLFIFCILMGWQVVLMAQHQNPNYSLGKKKFDNGEFTEASGHFTQALIADPKHGESFLYRGFCSLYMGRLKEAVADLDNAQKIIPTHADLYLAYGNLYNETGEYKKAIKYLDQAVKQSPKSAKALNARGFSYQSLGNYRSALENYSLAIAADTSYALAYNNRGSAIYYNQDIAAASKLDIRMALNDFGRAIRLEPGLCIAIRNKALAHNMLREYTEAQAEIEKAIECDARNPYNYMTYGSLLSAQDNAPQAINNFMHALEINPNLAEAYMEMARAKAKSKYFNEAEADLEKALALNKNLQPIIAYHKAAVFALTGNKKEMLNNLEKARKAGLFKNKQFITTFKSEPDFNTYRRDADFIKFVNKL